MKAINRNILLAGSWLQIIAFCLAVLPAIIGELNDAHATTLTGEEFCRSCHGSVADRHHAIDPSQNCFNCHQQEFVNGVTKISVERNCTVASCHGDYFNNHSYGDNHLRTRYNPLTDLAQESPGTPCAVCHDDSGGDLATWYDIRFEHDVVTNGSSACDTCHRSPRNDVDNAIQNGQAGVMQNCLDCHGDKETPATHGYVPHEPLGFVTKFAGCVSSGCHDGNEVVLDIHKADCSHCHAAIPALKPGLSAGNCLNCHPDRETMIGDQIMYGGAHHDNSPQSQNGDCTWCHADPRPKIEPNAPVIPSGQLACRQCHGTNKHNKGGPIKDYSVCFDCHLGIVPFHAKPMQWPGWYEENTSAPGRGSFNLFSNELRPRCAPDCEGTPVEDLPGYDEDAPPARDAGRNWLSPAISFNQITFFDFFNTEQEWTVPIFSSMDGGQQDSINITFAEYDRYRGRLTVYAENSMGRDADLSVIYLGNSYAMNWNSYQNRWEAIIYTTSCESTVDVVSSAGGSATSNVNGCDTGGPAGDSVNITRARYDSRSDRLVVYAENSLRSDAQLSVMYNGNSYDMRWDPGDNRWELLIDSRRCYDSNIEVVSSAGGSDSSNVENCSSWGY